MKTVLDNANVVNSTIIAIYFLKNMKRTSDNWYNNIGMEVTE